MRSHASAASCCHASRAGLPAQTQVVRLDSRACGVAAGTPLALRRLSEHHAVAVQVTNLEWEAEVLAQRFAAVQAERDSLYERFESSVYDVAQKTGEPR